MGAEPGRRSARVADSAQRRQLGVAVEAVPGLALPGRRAVAEHPAGVPLDAGEQLGLRRARESRATVERMPPAGSMQLLVARAGRAEGELVDPVAAERRVRVAVDQTRGLRSAPRPSSSSSSPSGTRRSRMRPTASIVGPSQST